MDKSVLLAKRLEQIQPFYVMDILAQAQKLQAQGRDIIHLEVGEPDFPTPQPIKNAARESIANNQLFYTSATGIEALKQKIARFYLQQFQLEIDPQRVIVTSGASAALFLVMAATLDSGDRLILSDPGYPCNVHFARLLGVQVDAVGVSASTGFQLGADLLASHWQQQTKAVLLASPANPTGAIIAPQQLQQISSFVRQQNGVLVVDEIYQGLTYDQPPQTALAIDDELIVINSFSKYFQMTGWRLGWAVVPGFMIKAMDKLAQNLYLSPPTTAQHAALQAFEADTLRLLEHRKDIFQQRRDYLYQALRDLGFILSSRPQGAFYLYADCSRFSDDSFQFCHRLLHDTAIAITPGRDFGCYNAHKFVRFAYTQDIQLLQQAVERLKAYL